jgi:hypothetical protein
LIEPRLLVHTGGGSAVAHQPHDAQNKGDGKKRLSDEGKHDVERQPDATERRHDRAGVANQRDDRAGPSTDAGHGQSAECSAFSDRAALDLLSLTVSDQFKAVSGALQHQELIIQLKRSFSSIV